MNFSRWNRWDARGVIVVLAMLVTRESFAVGKKHRAPPPLLREGHNEAMLEAYNCDQVVKREVCQSVPDTCMRIALEKEEYECPATYVRKCAIVESDCERVEYRLQEYMCDSDNCAIAAGNAAAVRVGRRLRAAASTDVAVDNGHPWRERVPEGLVPVVRLGAVDADVGDQGDIEQACTMETRQVAGTCKRTTFKAESYECSGGGQQCQSKVIKQQGMCATVARSEATTDVPQEYECVQMQAEDQCTQVPLKVEAQCSKTAMISEVYDCLKTEYVFECSGQDADGGANDGTDGANDGTDGANDGTDGANDGTDNANDGTDNANDGTDGGADGNVGAKINAVLSRMEVFSSEAELKAALGTRQLGACKSVPVQVNGTCERQVPKEQAYPCVKTEWVESCTQVQRPIKATCYAAAEMSGPCEHEQVVEMCIEGLSSPQSDGSTSLCTRMVPTQETVPCTKVTQELVCQPEDARRLADAVTSQGAEKRALKGKKHKKNEAATRTFTRRVPVMVAAKCSHTECAMEQVPAEQPCFRNVPTRVEYECTKTQCALQDVVVPKTCYRTMAGSVAHMPVATQAAKVTVEKH